MRFRQDGGNKGEAYKNTFYAEPERGLGEGSLVAALN